MGGSLKLRKVFGLKPKSSSANLQPQPITPDNFHDTNDIYANNNHNGGYHSYTPNGTYNQAPGLSSISELPAGNDYGNAYTHHAPSQQQHHQGHHNRMSLPAQPRPGPNPQYPHDPNAYYQHHDRSSGNLSPQDAVHSTQNGGNRDRRSASLGSRLSLSNFGSTGSNSSLGRSSVTTISSAATSPGPGPGPTSPHHLSQGQTQHPHSLSPGYQPNSPRYPGQPVHQPSEPPTQAQAQEQRHKSHLSLRQRATSQQYPPPQQPQQPQQPNVLHKVQPPYPLSERGSPPPGHHSRSSHSNAHNLQSFAQRSSLHPHSAGAQLHSGRAVQAQPKSPLQQAQAQAQAQSQQNPSAADIRRTTKLLRRLFELRLEQWTLSHSHESDQHLVHEKSGQVDAVLRDILGNVRSWGPPGGREDRERWTDDEWEDICLVREVLGEMSAAGPGMLGGFGGQMGMGMGYGVPVEVGGSVRGRW